MSISKVLKQEQQLAEALASVLTDEAYGNEVDELLSHVRMDRHSLTLARAVFAKLGVTSAYDAVLDRAVEELRIEHMLEDQQPKAIEAIAKLRAEFTGLPIDGLKALRLLIDSVISEKGG